MTLAASTIAFGGVLFSLAFSFGLAAADPAREFLRETDAALPLPTAEPCVNLWIGP